MNICYYGFPLNYRVEKRAVGETLVISFRSNEAGPEKIVYEGAPRVITKAIKKGLSLEEIVKEQVPAFLRSLFESDKPLPVERQRQTYNLPLAVIWALDEEKMREDGSWTENTVKEYDESFRWILQQWGELPLCEVTPAKCAPKLEKESTAKHKRIVRAIRQLFFCEAELGFLTDNPWDNYVVQGRRKAQNRDQLTQMHIADYVLARSHCERIVARCFEGLTRKADGGHYFAVLLAMTLAMGLEEIAALTFSNFEYLPYYPNRMCINVAQCLIKVGKNWKIRNIEQSAKVRRIAAPTIIRDALEIYKSTVAPKPDMYILRSLRNEKRHTTPKAFKDWVDMHFKDIIDECVMAGPILSKKDCYEILHATALRQLDICGYEDEEQRYVQGKKPKATHGKHYCDFTNEAELNRMGALLDRATGPWRCQVWASKFPVQQVLTRCGGNCEWATAPDCRGNIRLQIDFPAMNLEQIPEKGIELQVAIPYGGQINISYEGAA